jgi:hypothetical protein
MGLCPQGRVTVVSPLVMKTRGGEVDPGNGSGLRAVVGSHLRVTALPRPRAHRNGELCMNYTI